MAVAALPGLSRDVTVTLWLAFVLFAFDAIFSVGLTRTSDSVETTWLPATSARYAALALGVNVVEYAPLASGLSTRNCVQPCWLSVRCCSATGLTCRSSTSRSASRSGRR